MEVGEVFFNKEEKIGYFFIDKNKVWANNNSASMSKIKMFKLIWDK